MLFAACAVVVCNAATPPSAEPGPVAPPPACERTWRVVQTVPHDPTHFTQGLAIQGNVLFESTGLYGQSAVYREELRTGKVLASRPIPPGGFGEGLTRVGDRLVQITWREETGLVYDLALHPVKAFRYHGEGWGLATMPTLTGERLVLSDGSARLRFFDADSFEEIDGVEVIDGDGPVTEINELEYVDGEILANVWKSDRVLAIDPVSGHVKAWYDLSPLKRKFAPPKGYDAREDVLNGLALDPATGHVFATGKHWPAMYELKLGGCKTR